MGNGRGAEGSEGGEVEGGEARAVKMDEAISAWKVAVSVEPQLVEAHTLLASAFSFGGGRGRSSAGKVSKKHKRIALRHAQAAVSLAPSLASSYDTIATAVLAGARPANLTKVRWDGVGYVGNRCDEMQ